jgi:hypothetical protein
MITGPFLATMKHDVVAFRDHTLENNALARILARRLFKVVDETLPTVRDTWIVPDVFVSCVAFDRLTRAALVEHEVIEGHYALLVAFQAVHRHRTHVDVRLYKAGSAARWIYSAGSP